MAVLYYYYGTKIEKRRCSRPDCNTLIDDLDWLWVNVQGEYVYCGSCRSSAEDDMSYNAWKEAFKRGDTFVSTPDVINDLED